MQDDIALERKTREELKQLAMGLGIPKVSSLKKDEIIALIRQHREETQTPQRCGRGLRRAGRDGGWIWIFAV